MGTVCCANICVTLPFILHSLASVIPPGVMAKVASFSGISGLQEIREIRLMYFGVKSQTSLRSEVMFYMFGVLMCRKSAYCRPVLYLYSQLAHCILETHFQIVLLHILMLLIIILKKVDCSILKYYF